MKKIIALIVTLFTVAALADITPFPGTGPYLAPSATPFTAAWLVYSTDGVSARANLGLGTLATLNSATSNNLSGQINAGQVFGLGNSAGANTNSFLGAGAGGIHDGVLTTNVFALRATNDAAGNRIDTTYRTAAQVGAQIAGANLVTNGGNADVSVNAGLNVTSRKFNDDGGEIVLNATAGDGGFTGGHVAIMANATNINTVATTMTISSTNQADGSWGQVDIMSGRINLIVGNQALLNGSPILTSVNSNNLTGQWNAGQIFGLGTAALQGSNVFLRAGSGGQFDGSALTNVAALRATNDATGRRIDTTYLTNNYATPITLRSNLTVLGNLKTTNWVVMDTAAGLVLSNSFYHSAVLVLGKSPGDFLNVSGINATADSGENGEGVNIACGKGADSSVQDPGSAKIGGDMVIRAGNGGDLVSGTGLTGGNGGSVRIDAGSGGGEDSFGDDGFIYLGDSIAQAIFIRPDVHITQGGLIFQNGAVISDNYGNLLASDGNGNLTFNGGDEHLTIRSLADPNDVLDAANKQYVDGGGGADRTPTSVVVGPSPFSFTNDTSVRLEVYFSGGTAYSLTKNGVAVYGSLGGNDYTQLAPTNVCVLTYTVAPTMKTNQW